jgi:hypothetical protein
MAQEQAGAEKNRNIPTIRVMKVMIHADNTFSTLAGLGDTTILRGRFSVIGDQRDQVWMQSLRFGFGRSVSGSTYSEGNALGEETKSYWGKISYEDEDDDNTNSGGSGSPEATTSDNTDDDQEEKPRRLYVKGSVIVGWGLEPQPIARFIMREAVDDAEFFDEYEDDEEDDEEEDNDDNDIDEWSSSNAFQ